MLKSNDCVLSLAFLEIGEANEKDNGPIGVIRSTDVPIEILGELELYVEANSESKTEPIVPKYFNMKVSELSNKKGVE